MKKLTLIALASEKDNLLAKLSRAESLHLINMQEFDNTQKLLATQQKDLLTQKMQNIDQALAMVKNAVDREIAIKKVEQKELKTKKTKKVANVSTKKDKTVSQKDKKLKEINLAKREIVDYDELIAICDKQDVLFDNISNITSLSSQIDTLTTEITALRANIANLEIYRNLDVAFSDIVSTSNCLMLLGIANSLTQEKLEELASIYTSTQFVFLGQNKQQTALLAICDKRDLEQISKVLSGFGFAQCVYDYPVTATQYILSASKQIEDKLSLKQSLNQQLCDYEQYFPQLKTLYDYFYINKQIYQTDSDILCTQSTIALQGWLPEEQQSNMQNLLDSNLSAYFSQFDQPTDDEEVPTKIKVNKIVQPFTSITDMYSIPNYREIDPNPIVAVFYWLFMGLIMGDVGYGVLMCLIAVLFVKFIKPRGGMRSLILVIGYSSISTIIWGVVFGGWFAMDVGAPPPILFTPLGDPLGMIELCLVLGTVHLLCGVIMNFANLIAKRKIWDAIFDCIPWIIFDIGIILVIIGAFSSLNPSGTDLSILATIGLIMMGSGLVIVLFTAGRKNKGFGKVTGGLGGVYGVMNVFTDILSYLRLFGLGLTTGVVGLVFNTIAGLLLGNPFLFIFGVIVLIFGHTLNLAISLLGAYIHDARLQHIEFFGKFYTGEGFYFTPIASQRKYTYPKEEPKKVKIKQGN